MPYHKKVSYVRCGCGFRKQNTAEYGPWIGAGDYCPRCGTKLTEYNELTRQSYVRAGPTEREPDTWTPPSRRQLAVRVVSMAIPLFAIYAVFQFLVATAGGKTLTINGETAPLFDPGMANAVFAVVAFAAFAVHLGPDAVGYVKHRRLA
jgi:sterol desaturase/sphingolipid hydroxylase (fatty acid hydroxylase superfamily)